ncbi:MAG: hypothetical protein JW774_03020 [Candidatus Aureabacteria bacterium]|nr:hypothetical protein [Candidatus Auribacterota bacterium]
MDTEISVQWKKSLKIYRCLTAIFTGIILITSITGCETLRSKHTPEETNLHVQYHDEGRIIYYKPKGNYFCREYPISIPVMNHPEGTSGELAMMNGKGAIEAIVLGPKNLAVFDKNGHLTGYKQGPGYIKSNVNRERQMEINTNGDTLIYEKGQLIQVCKKNAQFIFNAQGKPVGSERKRPNGTVEKFDLLGQPLTGKEMVS